MAAGRRGGLEETCEFRSGQHHRRPADAARPGCDTAGTFVVAWEDSATQTLNVLTNPPGGGFAPAATFQGVAVLGDLKIAPGHAVLTFAPGSFGGPMKVSSEPVS